MTQKKLFDFLHKNAWLTILLILSGTGVICSIYGFYEKGNDFPESLYKTLQLFVLNVSFGEGGIEITPLLQWGRWLLFAASLWAAYRLFIEILAPKWWQKQKQYFPYENRYLFVGVSEQAKILAQSLSNDHCLCIFLVSKEKEDDKALFDELRDRGAIVLYANFEGEVIKFPQKIDKFFFVGEDEDFNMEMADRLLNQLGMAHIYIRTQSREFYSYVKKYTNAEIHIFNQSDLTARLFVKENPMLDSPNIEIDQEKLFVKGEFNVLFLGFGWQGRELLNKCICNSQFKGSTFRATIIDKDFDTLLGDYPVLFDECKEQYNLQFKSEAVGSKAFYEWLDVEIYNFNRIIIALGSDEINMDTAEKITNFMNTKGIKNTNKIVFARVQKLKCYSNNFTPFGKLTDIYTKEMIVNEEVDIIAKHLHFQWADKAKYPTVEKAWFQDGSDILWNRDSSRAAAMGICNILHLLGMKYIKKNEIKNNIVVEDKQFNSIVESYMDVLAENEHKRWNAYHFTKGIRLWKMDDIDYEKLKKSAMNANQIKEYNRHAALIDFDQLPELDKIINTAREKWNAENPNEKPKKSENNKQKDREYISAIPASLNQAKYVIIYKNIKQ